MQDKIVLTKEVNTTLVYCKDAAVLTEVSRLLYGSLFYFSDSANPFNPAFASGRWDGKVRLFDRLNKTFPSGLSYRVANLLAERYGLQNLHLIDKTKELSVVKDSTLVYQGGLIPRSYQLGATEAAVAKRYGVVNLPTGSGKSLAMAHMIHTIQPSKTIIVVEGKRLLNQTVKAMTRDFPMAEVLQWGAGKQQRMPVGGKPLIIVATYQSFANASCERIAREADVVLIDECQNVGAETFSAIGRVVTNAVYKIGLTATDFRAGNDSILIEAYIGRTIYKVTYSDMIALGTVVQPIINEINIDNMSEEVFKNFLKDKKALIFTEKIADMQALLEIHPWLPYTHAQQSVKEQVAAVELFTRSPKAVLVVTPIMDSGVDIPDVDTVIHYRTSTSSVKCIQRGGRAMRRPTPDKTVCYWFHNTATRKEQKTFKTLVDTVYNLDDAFRRGLYGKY